MINNKIYEIYKVLYKTYGQQGWWPLVDYKGTNVNKEGNILGYHMGNYSFPRNRLEIFEICLGAFLTQNTTFTSVVKSLHNLKALNALSPKGIQNLDIDVFKLAIKPSGYYNQKAKYILGFITFFETLKDTVPTRDKLLKVLGVGEETADSILLYAYNKEEFVVDSYTKRIFISLGIINNKTKYMEIKMIIQNALRACITQKEDRIIIYQEYHALIVTHAKNFYSRKPYGIGCILRKNYYLKEEERKIKKYVK